MSQSFLVVLASDTEETAMKKLTKHKQGPSLKMFKFILHLPCLISEPFLPGILLPFLSGQRDLKTTTWESDVLLVVAVWLLSALSGGGGRAGS